MNGGRGLLIAVLSAALVGGAAGMIGGVMFSRSALGLGPIPRHAPGPPRGFHERGPMMRGLERQLDLSPEQAARIDSILERSRYRYDAMRESVRVAVERELTAEQRLEWRKMQSRFRRFRPPGRGPGRGFD